MGKCYETYERSQFLLMRSNEQIQKIKQFQGIPFSVKGIVDPASLLEYYFSNNNDVIEKNTGPKVLEIDSNHHLLSPILAEMQKYTEPFKVRYAHFFDVTDPHIIHNDDTFEYPNCYKAFTIPLKIYGESNDIKLVIFDQYYYGGPSKFFNGETIIENVYYNKPLTEYSSVENRNTVGIKEEFRKEYLGHLKDSWIEGLSVNAVLEWNVGDALCFDSLALHCSSNFKSKSIERKIGLSIFTVKE